MLKKIFFLAFVSCLVLVMIFHESVILLGARWVIHSYSMRHLGESVQYDEINLENQAMVLRHLHSEKFTANEVKVSFAMDWSNRQWNVLIDVDHPTFVIEPTQEKSTTWSSWFPRLNTNWIQVNAIWKIHQGKLNWDVTNQNAWLTFNLDAGSLSGGSIEGFFNDQDHATDAFKLKTFQRADTFYIDWQCHQLQCPSLLSLLSTVMPEFRQAMIPSGIVDGNVTIVLPINQEPFAQGELAFNQIQFHHQSGLQGDIGKAKLILEKQSPEGSKTHAHLEFLENAHLKFGSWELKQLIGHFQISEMEKVFLHFQGVQNDSPFNLKGHLGWEENAHGEINLTCDNEGHLQLLVHSDQTVEMHIRQLSYQDWGPLQTLIGSYYPALAGVVFQEGSLNAYAIGEWSSEGIKRIDCQDFKIEHLKFSIPQKKIMAECPLSTGKGSLDPIQENVDGEIHIEEGRFTYADRYPFTEINTDLVISQGRVHSSPIHFELAGSHGVLEADWGEGSHQLNVKLKGEVQNIAEWLPQAWQNGLYKGFKEYPFELVTHLHENQFKGQLQVGISHSLIFQGDLVEGNPKGYFAAEGLPLDTFLAPFIFYQIPINLKGVAQLNGTFNPEKIFLQYDIKDVSLENETWRLEFPSATGSHEVNLISYEHQGSLPIPQASIHEKNHELEFSDLKAELFFIDDTVKISDLEAICCNMTLAGEGLIRYQEPFFFSLSIPWINGHVSNLRALLNQLKWHDSLQLAQIPLEGDFESSGDGLQLKIDSDGVHTAFQGNILNGMIAFEEKYLTLQELYLGIKFTDQQVELTDLQAILLAGKPADAKEYNLIGNYLRILENDPHQLEGDLELFLDQSLARVVFQTHREDDEQIELELDPHLSHIAGIHPSQFKLAFYDWSSLAHFHVEADFKLEEVESKFKPLSYPILLAIYPYLSSHMPQMEKGKGQFHLMLDYDPQKQWSYDLHGEQGELNDHHYQAINLKGRKQANRWLIDQFQVDDLSLYADLWHHDNLWKIDFLGLNDGKRFLLGLKGEWQKGSPFLQTSVQLLETDLALLNHYESLRSLINQWQPEGLLKGKGNLKIYFLGEAPWFDIEANMQIQSPLNVRLKGSSFFASQPVHFQYRSRGAFKLTLNDGTYTFKQHPFEIKNFSLEIQPEELHFNGEMREGNFPFALQGRATWPQLDHAHLVVQHTLNVDLDRDIETGWSIQSVQGTLAGMDMQLKAASTGEKTYPAWTILQGHVMVDSNQICPLLIQDWRLSSHFLLNGTFWMNGDLNYCLFDSSYFKGTLSADDAIVNGILVKKISMDVDYTPQTLKLNNLIAEDEAVTIRCDTMTLNRAVDEWHLFTPQLIVKNLQPSLLRTLDHAPSPHFKSLLIRRIEFENVSGRISRLPNWQGEGYLHFLNPTRKEHSLLAIPSEVMHGLGVDPHVLNPVTGTIYFDLKGDRFYLTKFKDVYSEGRGSKFYLADTTTPSWIDMEGNLFLQVRMKQYNLMFKLAEMFTLSIQGNIQKPKYSLFKHEKS